MGYPQISVSSPGIKDSMVLCINIHINAQNVNSNFQKLEENKTVEKNRKVEFFAHFLPKIFPKNYFFKNPKMSRSKLA